MPRIETFLAIMIHSRTKYIPVSHISLCKLVPGKSPCKRMNMLVNTKDILRISACQKVSIMTHVINARRSVTPRVTTFDRTIRISLLYVHMLLFDVPFVHHLYDYYRIYPVPAN